MERGANPDRKNARASDFSAWRSAYGNWEAACACLPRRDAGRRSRSACPARRQRKKRMTKILIADDHGIVRTGLRLLFERVSDMEVVGEAAEGRQAVRMAKE